MAPAKEDLPRRIALAHEWFSPRSTGGAELVVQAIDALLCSLHRTPQLAALVDGESARPGSWLFGRDIRTSPIQQFPWGISHVQQYLPLLPLAIEQIDLGEQRQILLDVAYAPGQLLARAGADVAPAQPTGGTC